MKKIDKNKLFVLFDKERFKNMYVVNDIRDMRLLYSLTQAELAHLCGVSRNIISSIELGKSMPSLELAIKLSIIFDCYVEELFNLKYDDNSN